jgi:hypothetical protein
VSKRIKQLELLSNLSNKGIRRTGPGALGVTRWSMGETSPGRVPEGVGARVTTALPLLGSEFKKIAAFVFKLQTVCQRC